MHCEQCLRGKVAGQVDPLKRSGVIERTEFRHSNIDHGVSLLIPFVIGQGAHRFNDPLYLALCFIKQV